jgi:hypothetical protein
LLGKEQFTNWELMPSVESVAPGRYANSSSNFRLIVANKYVHELGFYLSSFSTPDYSDSLMYGADWLLYDLIGGSRSNLWIDIESPSSMQAGPAFFKFVTNRTVNSSGFQFTGARACCNVSGYSSPAQIEYMQRVQGFLLATNDVVYLTLPADNTASHLAIALWGDHIEGNDFDIYVRCNQVPTTTSYDYGGPYAGDSDLVHIPSNVCSNGTWHIAINARALAAVNPINGVFNIYATKHRPSMHFAEFRVGTDFPQNVFHVPSFSWVDMKTKIPDTLRDAAAFLFAATEGAVYVESFKVTLLTPCADGNWNTVGCTNYPSGLPIRCICDGFNAAGVCRQCIHLASRSGLHGAASGVCVSPGENAYFDVYNYLAAIFDDYSNLPQTIAHEAMHTLFCANDEYSGTQIKCTHSILANTNGKSRYLRNACFSTGAYNCDHGWDPINYTWNPPVASDALCQPYGSWDDASLAGVLPTGYYPTETPDAYHFASPQMDFHSRLGVVTFTN